MSNFFNHSPVKAALRRFKSKIKNYQANDTFESTRDGKINLFIISMEKSPEDWGNRCKLSIEQIGNEFINSLEDKEELNKDKLDMIFALCFQFIIEINLSTKGELDIEFDNTWEFAIKNISNFEKEAQSRIDYIIKDMPLRIVKDITNSVEIDNLKQFNKNYNNYSKLKEEWDSDLEIRELRVNNLKDSLSKYENAFNFVGLFQGFDELSKEKNNELKGISRWLKILSSAIVIPLIIQISYIYIHIDEASEIKDGLLLLAIPTISLIFISIYYFRVLLFNYKSVKSQLLQIDLRKTLCRFIQHYSDYSTPIKKNDSSSLEKFENIIFSGIVSDEENLPSTFDGIEQLAKIIKSAKA